MSQLWSILQRQRYWALWAVGIGAVVLLPLIWSYGFWDPQEIQIADKAREVAAGKPLSEVAPDQPPLILTAISTSIDTLGVNEMAARLPLVLLGLIAMAATFGVGARLGSPRAGLLSALVLLSFPLFVLESRQLTSSIGLTCAHAGMMFGIVGLMWPARGRPGWMTPADAIAVVVAAVLGFLAGGALLGLVIPLGAAAIAGLVALTTRGRATDDDDARDARRRLALGTAVAGVAAVVALGWVIAAVWDLTDAKVGDRAVLGKTVTASKEYVAALGGIWRIKVPEAITWDTLFEHMAYGMYPWIALAPVALLSLAGGGSRDDRATNSAGPLLIAWAGVAWLLATIYTLKVGPVRFPGMPAFALATGLWLDRLLTARAEADAGGGSATTPSHALALPLLGFAVALAVVMLGKDLLSTPDKLASLHLLGSGVKYPTAVGLKWLPLVLGGVLAAALLAGLWLWTAGGRRGSADDAPVRAALDTAGRYGIHVATATGVVFAAAIAFLWTPRLSEHFSYKNLFESYDELHSEGDKLGVMGIPGSGPEYYAPHEFETLKSRNELTSFLAMSQRAFAIAPAGELCAIHQAAGSQGFSYYVLDDENSRFLLLSNQLRTGQTDRNPLLRAVLREPPTDIQRPLDINFDNEIQLIGVNMPSRVDRGSVFEMTLYFKVLAKPKRNWKIFLHFDGGGVRFQGDHDPIGGRCGTAYWQPGDYIVDRFEVEAGGMTFAKTTYQLWAGLFVGSSGNWTNMKALSGNPDNNNRVQIGSIQLQ